MTSNLTLLVSPFTPDDRKMKIKKILEYIKACSSFDKKKNKEKKTIIRVRTILKLLLSESQTLFP